jgi:drug/metabolite transporter (DMT)-like permease
MPLSGCVLIFCGCFVFLISSVLVKTLTAVDPFLINGVRSSIIFLLSVPWLVKDRISPFPKGKVRNGLFRCLMNSLRELIG